MSMGTKCCVAVIIITAVILILYLAVPDIFTDYTPIFKESFKAVPLRPQIEGPYGLGYSQRYEPIPLQVNFIPKLLGSDFKLNGHIRKLKMNSNYPTSVNGHKRAFIEPGYSFGGLGAGGGIRSSLGPTLCPIILVPDIGASKVLVKWNKIDSMSVKKTDAYNKFQEITKWACKDIEQNWNKLWFPNDTVGLSRYCWQDLVKTIVNPNNPREISNGTGITTSVDNMGSMNFESDIYNTLIEMLYAMSYVQGSSLYAAEYDHRLIFSPNIFYDYSRSLKNMIESSVRLNGRLAILMGHGLGSVIINMFLNNQTKAWKTEYIASFITVSGSFGSVPKALRVLLSGDTLPDTDDQNLIRTGLLGASALHLMTPDTIDSELSDSPIVQYNYKNYYARNTKDLIDIAAESLHNTSASEIYNISKEMKAKALSNPDVNVHSLTGSGVDTESSYIYSDILSNPTKIVYTDGDGTIPKNSLDIPNKWASQQSENVTYKKYVRAEHSKILKLYEPMVDLSIIIDSYNKN